MAVSKRIKYLIEEYVGQGQTTYRVRWREGGRGSKEHHPTFASLKEAEKFRDLIRYITDRRWPTDAQLLAHGFGDLAAEPPPPAPTLTVADMCRHYLRWLATDKHRSPKAKTIATYQGHIDKRIARTPLGAMDAMTVTWFDVQDWQSYCMRELGYSPNSVRPARTGMLDPAFKWATSMRSAVDRDGGPLLPRANPMPDADHLPEQEFIREILTTPAEYVTTLRLARAIHPRWADLLLMEAATGMRKSEAAALDHDAILRFRGAVALHWHMVDGRREPDTKSGRREVPVPGPVLEHFAGRRGILLPATYGGRWSSDSHLWNKLRPAMAEHGIPVHLTHHSFRHGLATWLGSKRIDPVRIKLMMGHGVTSVAEKYRIRLTDKDRSMIRDATGELLGLD
jgi:integrase